MAWMASLKFNATARFSRVDIMLPDIDGFQVKKVRAAGCFMPILAQREHKKVIACKAGGGADDYLSKPFSAKELVARVKALLRRAYGLGYRDVRQTNGVVVDSYQRHALLNGNLLDLRGKEFDLLAQLVSSPGRATPVSNCWRAFGVITLRAR